MDHVLRDVTREFDFQPAVAAIGFTSTNACSMIDNLRRPGSGAFKLMK